MGAMDALFQKSTNEDNAHIQSSTPKKSQNANNFANLSPNVQKILSNVSDQELSRKFSSEETLGTRRSTRCSYRSQKSPEKNLHHISNESLDVISPGIQKMLSNFPDSELVISTTNLHNGEARINRNASFLHTIVRNGSGTNCLEDKVCNNECNSSDASKSFLYQSFDGTKGDSVSSECNKSEAVFSIECLKSLNDGDGADFDYFSTKPLGSYLHTSSSGIASRTPVGRKNMGKFLQVPSESSVGTNSTASSEVSRPVSLTSLGSCSSSGSSGHNQVGSAYLASAESLDSDPEPTGSQDSADSGIADQPCISPEMRVLQEVMDTEAVYVSDLGEVIQGYLLPWRSNPENPITQHLQALFGNLEEIHKFNRSFLQELRLAGYDSTNIANVFLHNDSGFSVYTEYCTNYPRTMDILGELTRNEIMAPLFREQQMKLCHALPLGSYLLKPVQRILKYHLLLQRLSKQCESRHKPAVDLALATMTGVASDINTMKRKHEHAVRVQEIQSQLYGWSGPDLTALGELIAEGTFRVSGARGRRHVYLFDKVLLMAKSKQDGSLAYKTHINCSNLMLVEQVRGEPLSFHVLPFDNPRLQCTLRARSSQHKREWTLQIKRVILENYSAVIPNHARQLVLQLGQEINDTDISENWPPLKQHSTPQYLERRSRVRKTRNLSNRRAASQDRSLVSLGSWRRKSEPSMIPQYDAKTVPKKISNLKKAKESSAKFYTDFSDSENCDAVDEMSLETKSDQNTSCIQRDDTYDDIQESSLENDPVPTKSTLEQVVSDLLMQNKEFQKVMNRRKNVRDSEPLTNVWLKQENSDLPTKSDSLPRNIQLNDQIVCDGKNSDLGNGNTIEGNKENAATMEIEEQHDVEVSSQIDDSEHPEHKIYRKSAIRFSLLQRFRAIMSEEQKRIGKFPTHKQGSRSMGEKIAHPDYADPLKLFSNSRNSSQANLNFSEPEKLEVDLMDEPEQLDMTINEKDVFNEIVKRMNKSLETVDDKPISDTGQQITVDCKSSHGSDVSETINKSDYKQNVITSSHNSDSFYESIMEKNLNAGTNNLCSSNSSNETPDNIRNNRELVKDVNSSKKISDSKVVLKRPTKAPPPIPVKPKGLLSVNSNNFEKPKSSFKVSNECSLSENVSITRKSVNGISKSEHLIETSSKSWVKTMVGRFE